MAGGAHTPPATVFNRKANTMKQIKTSILAIALVAFVVGCATPTPAPNGPTSAQQAIAVINALVPVAVQYAVAKDPTSVAYFQAAAAALDIAIATNAISPVAIQADLAAIDPKLATPEASLAIAGGLAVYEVFFAGQIASDTNTVAVLQAVDTSIRAGLPQPSFGTAKILRIAR